MNRSNHHAAMVQKRFPDLQPLRAPDRNLTAELAYVGYWAAQEGDKLFLIIGYHPKTNISERLDEMMGNVLTWPSADVIELEEYDQRDEWRQRVVQLITPPGSGAEPAGAGVPRRPVPKAPAFPATEPFPL